MDKSEYFSAAHISLSLFLSFRVQVEHMDNCTWTEHVTDSGTRVVLLRSDVDSRPGRERRMNFNGANDVDACVWQCVSITTLFALSSSVRIATHTG